MTLAVTARNQAGSLSLHLADADGTTHSYRFDLRKLKPGAYRSRWRPITARRWRSR